MRRNMGPKTHYNRDIEVSSKHFEDFGEALTCLICVETLET